MRGCNCNSMGWGRPWKKELCVGPAKHMTGRAEAAGQPGVLLACRNWQGMKTCPCSKKKRLLVRPPTSKCPFFSGMQKRKILPSFPLQQRFTSKRVRRKDGEALRDISHLISGKTDLEASAAVILPVLYLSPPANALLCIALGFPGQ